MAYLGNDAVNRVNLHSGVQALAQSGGGVFFVVFLVRVGLSIPDALTTMAAVFAARFMLRPLILPLARRWGLKPLLILGTLLMAGQYPLIAEVHGVGVALAAFAGVSALGDTFYWSSYHAYFAAIGDAEHRGHQIGAREALVAVVGILAPLAGAWALVTLGPKAMFAGVAAIQALAVIPLLGAPNVAVEAGRAPAPSRGVAGRDAGRRRWLVRRLLHPGLADRPVWVVGTELLGLWRRHGAGRPGRGGVRPVAGPPHRRGTWPPRGRHRLFGDGGRGVAARPQHRLALAGGRRQRPGRAFGDVDAAGGNRDLQSGQGLALSPALQPGHRGGLGRRLLAPAASRPRRCRPWARRCR